MTKVDNFTFCPTYGEGRVRYTKQGGGKDMAIMARRR
jgi:hypothetical protein